MSILGFVGRRPLVSLGAAAALWWLWPGGDPAPGAGRARVQPQAAALADGFAALADGGRLARFDHDAHRRRELVVREAPPGARVVGVGGGVGLVWRDGKQVAVALVDDDGRLGDRPQRFGKRVASMCGGVASNEHQFGVAWLESDGSVWFVHGPTAARGAAAEPGDGDGGGLVAEAAGLPEGVAGESCAIASAHDKIALLWTERGRTTLVMCGRRCGSPGRVALPKGSEVLGLGCSRGGCAIATRGEGGGAALTWVTPKGRAQWTKPLPHAEPGTAVALAGTTAQVAIAYATANEPVAVTASSAGEIATVWQGAADGVPGLAHAGGRLLVARIVDGELAGSVVRVP